MFSGICYSFAFLLVAGSLPLAAAVDTPSLVKEGVTYQQVKPLRGLIYTEKDIDEVRRRVRENGANAELVAEILRVAQEWVQRPDEVVAGLIPGKGALFAYGMAGDPKNNRSWPRFAREKAMCSFDRPGTVRSPETMDIYGAAKEGEPFYDDGKGWKRDDGQMFYFKGIWNAWIVDQLHDGVDHLAMAYLLTGDPSFARRALFILDRLASLRVQLPLVGNSAVDWPHNAASDEAKGFFHYMGNIANQRTVNTALGFDLIANAPFGAEPSSGDGKLTVSENIAKNYFGIYERRYIDTMRSLTNHGIILVGNLMIQGVLFGDAQKMSEGLDGMRAFFDNTINRDGDYMEVSGSYGRLGRDYGSRLVMPMANYDPKNYPAEAKMPDAAPYTGGVKPGDDPRWYNTAVRMLYRLPLLGRYPQYGDMSMDRSVLVDTDNEWLAKHRALYLRVLYQQTSRPEWKREIEELYPRAASQKQAPLMLEDLLLFGPALWSEPKALTHDDKKRAEQEPPAAEASDFMAAKGIAVLRSGEKADARALFLRGGINSWHGHDDQMMLVPYGQGMVLFGEYGYRWAGTPDNLGWGTRSIAHNMAVVDEDEPAPYLYKGFSKEVSAPAASVTAFMKDGIAQFVEMRNPLLFKKAKLQDYRRTAWLVDVDAAHYYFVDIFQVLGGRVHDYAWTAPSIARSKKEEFKVEGVKPVALPGVWTLASLGGKHRDEVWNQPGKSWGERLNGDNGMVVALPGESKLPVSKWNPKPGNGYGMIWDVKAAETKGDWRAQWPLPDGEHSFRTHFVNFDGMTAISALSPTMNKEIPFNPVYLRRTRDGNGPLHSRFVNVAEVAKPGQWVLKDVERLQVDVTGEATDCVGLRITLAEGKGTDMLFASRSVQEMKVGKASDRVVFEGRNGFVRTDAEGRLVALSMQEGRRFEAAGWGVETDSSLFQAIVRKVEPGREESRLTIEGNLPAGSLLAGATLWTESGQNGSLRYSHNDYFSIESIDSSGNGESVLVFHNQPLTIASLQIESLVPQKQKALLAWNHNLAGKPGSMAYDGRAVIPSGTVVSLENPPKAAIQTLEERSVGLTRLDGFKAGDRIDVLVAKPGDIVSMPTTVSIRPHPSLRETWLLRSTLPVRLTFPDAKGGVQTRQFPAGESVVTL